MTEICNMEGKQTQDTNFRDFWNEPLTVQAERALDVWASVYLALREGCSVPTLEAIFELNRRDLPAFWVIEGKDGEMRRKVTGWESRYSSISGPVRQVTATDRPLPPALLTFLAVEVILDGLDIDPRRLLLRDYPRTGIYSSQANATDSDAEHWRRSRPEAGMKSNRQQEAIRKSIVYSIRNGMRRER
jgi:hypothetical protein